MKKRIQKLDKNNLWHPFSQSKNFIDPIIIETAKNEKLTDIDGNDYVDLISSWWVNTHGHCKKEIVESINFQANKLEQVLFSGLTHNPAVTLANELLNILPNNLSKVFYSDNGSTAVEIAMKVAIQYWYNLGEKKKKFVALKGGYHGDTFGSMSVGFSSGYYEPFKDFLLESRFIPYPEFWNGNNEIEENESYSFEQADKILTENNDDIAAIIIEPLVQGASGMKMSRKCFVNELVKKFQNAGILVIFDEVMTGFGRTGKMFATDYLDVKPDIMCLAKSLTGGYIPLAATIFSQKIHQAFCDDDIKKAFLHGHSYTANPVGCSAAIASINLFDKEKTISKIKKISEIHKECLLELSKKLNVSKIRCLGSIAAFDLNKFDKAYGSDDGEKLKKKFLENGLLIRPIGNTIYLMPPYCIEEDCLYDCYEKIIKILR
tara:strand:- start:145 stop:1443 length:1299 start_codon:yes stop_codon:yes gene_type:complete